MPLEKTKGLSLYSHYKPICLKFASNIRVTVEHAKPDRSRGYRGGGGYNSDRRDYGRRDGGNSFRDR